MPIVIHLYRGCADGHFFPMCWGALIEQPRIMSPVAADGCFRQRMAASRPPANPGEERKRGGSRRGRSRIRPISPVSKTLHDDERASDVGSGFHSSREPSAASEVERALGESTRIFKGHTDNDQVVHVPGETARWILTNQPEHEDAITMQVGFFCTSLFRFTVLSTVTIRLFNQLTCI